MTDGRFRAGVQPGDGVVARYGAVAVVVAPGGDAFTDALVRLVSVAHDDPRTLVWQMIGLVAAHQPGVPHFALAIGGPESRRVLVHGSARAVVDDEEVDGTRMWTWCERTFGAHQQLALTVAEGPVVPAPRSDLRDGVLSGVGLLLEPETAGAEADEPELAPGPPLEAAPAGRPRVVPPRPPTRQAVRTAIKAIPHETVHITASIAALHADDGSRVPLDRDYVFGRDPHQDVDVLRGTASPIKVDDGEQLISRVHARVSVAGGAVTVRDAGSANGTFVAAPGDPGWTRIGPEPVPIPVGHSVRIGVRVYTHLPAEG